MEFDPGISFAWHSFVFSRHLKREKERKVLSKRSLSGRCSLYLYALLYFLVIHMYTYTVLVYLWRWSHAKLGGAAVAWPGTGWGRRHALRRRHGPFTS